MKIKLANDMELTPLMVIGEKRYIHGMNRDSLSFVFPVKMSLDKLELLFTEANCEKITITDDEGNEYIHSAYTIRVELKRTPVEVTPATESKDAVYENRTIVTVAQRTYQETQMIEMQNALAVLAGKEG